MTLSEVVPVNDIRDEQDHSSESKKRGRPRKVETEPPVNVDTNYVFDQLEGRVTKLDLEREQHAQQIKDLQKQIEELKADFYKIASVQKVLNAFEKAPNLRETVPGKHNKASSSKEANVSELDSEHGDPVVKRDPALYKDESFVGKKFSECSPKYLRALADFFEWKGEKFNNEWAKKDAKFARGWARRIEENGGQTATLGSSKDEKGLDASREDSSEEAFAEHQEPSLWDNVDDTAF